jgi:hypothetical protein
MFGKCEKSTAFRVVDAVGAGGGLWQDKVRVFTGPLLEEVAQGGFDFLWVHALEKSLEVRESVLAFAPVPG